MPHTLPLWLLLFTLSPSLPPFGFPHSFPDCICERRLSRSPYRVQFVEEYPNIYGGNTYCFKFMAVQCMVDNTCCEANLEKWELPMRECGRAMKSIKGCNESVVRGVMGR